MDLTQLPFRIASKVDDDQPVLSVDGSFGAPGLNLSHWPGNTTPPEFRHDLSTGSALLFAKAEPAVRERWAAGATAIVNNHYDTDGTCAAFALLHPEVAQAHAETLLDAARAGDFFAHPTATAYAIDQLTAIMADPERSPIAARLRGLEDSERYERASQAMFAALPELLQGKLTQEQTELVKLGEERWLADCESLEQSQRDDLVHLDWTIFTGASSESESHNDAGSFDPGRHAVFARMGSATGNSTSAGNGLAELDGSDRILLVGPASNGSVGHTYRFLISTLSWFDQSGRLTQGRPSLEALAHTLNQAEAQVATGAANSAPTEPKAAWHHQSDAGASPELWFGAPGLPLYSEHASGHLAHSQLEPVEVRRHIIKALRSALVLPE